MEEVKAKVDRMGVSNVSTRLYTKLSYILKNYFYKSVIDWLRWLPSVQNKTLNATYSCRPWIFIPIGSQITYHIIYYKYVPLEIEYECDSCSKMQQG